MKSPPFAFFLSLSLSAHLLLFGGMFLMGLFDLFAPARKPALIIAAKVDLVALPDLPSLKKKPAKAAKKNPPKPKAKAFPAGRPKKPLDKPRAKSPPPPPKALEKKPEPPQREALDPGAKEAEPESGPAKGNRLSEGWGESGRPAEKQGLSEEERQALAAYLNPIIRQIKSHWNLPKYLVDENLFAELEIKISDHGEIIAKSLITSSLNDFFDRRILAAIEKSAPFPPPPPAARKILSDGIVFGLSSRD